MSDAISCVVRLTWLLHSLKRGPVMTRQDCSTVTNLTMLWLQGGGIYTYKVRFVRFLDSP